MQLKGRYSRYWGSATTGLPIADFLNSFLEGQQNVPGKNLYKLILKGITSHNSMNHRKNGRIFKRGSGVRSGQPNSQIASHYEWTAWPRNRQVADSAIVVSISRGAD